MAEWNLIKNIYKSYKRLIWRIILVLFCIKGILNATSIETGLNSSSLSISLLLLNEKKQIQQQQQHHQEEEEEEEEEIKNLIINKKSWKELMMIEKYDITTKNNDRSNNNGIIYGNPLEYKECSDILLKSEMYDIQFLEKQLLLQQQQQSLSSLSSSSPSPSSWFWSRESISAVEMNLILHRSVKIHSSHPFPILNIPFSWYRSIINQSKYSSSSSSLKISDNLRTEFLKIIENGKTYSYLMSANKKDVEKQKSSIIYYHIEKSASSSTSTTLYKPPNNFTQLSLYENYQIDKRYLRCGFTVVRHPIHRFISAYYTANQLSYNRFQIKKIPLPLPFSSNFTFWKKKKGEPERLVAFIEDMHRFGYYFLQQSPLEHMYTQTGILSVSHSPIHWIGKTESYQKHMKTLVRNSNISKLNSYTSTEDNPCLKSLDAFTMEAVMVNYGANERNMDDTYREWMSLQYYASERQLLPAYYILAECYELFLLVVKYYLQDFVCFNYDIDWQRLRKYVSSQDPFWKFKITTLREIRHSSNFDVYKYPRD